MPDITSKTRPALAGARGSRWARRPVNWRSVAIGLAGVVVIGGLTPYNDFAVNNTYFIGTYLPGGVVLILLLLLVGVNVALRPSAATVTVPGAATELLLFSTWNVEVVTVCGLIRSLNWI